MINNRLFEWYGIDTKKDLKINTFCTRPFDTVLIDKQGSCFVCECAAWLPQSIGNLQVKTLSEILQSTIRGHMQSSIMDGSYRYCNNKQCSYLLYHNRKGTPWKKDTPTNQIKHIRLAIDDSCNLRCPSCRNGLIFHKEGSAYNLGIRLADSINDWLHAYDNPIKVHIGSDGDPFASHVYRHFMEQTPERDNIKYSLLTNSLMFKEIHHRIQNVIRNLDDLGVSIDGASQDTYEKLRLGGRWDKVNENLECIAELKQKHNFQLGLHMVVQADNWHEMEDMLALGHRYNADRIYFNKIEDWNTNIDMGRQKFTHLDEFTKMAERVEKDPISHMNVHDG